ncbi:rhodanese-related sulfurtransferase [Rivularia sp. PCC 7116]|uniref:sulfurtransferase n=1 Tax=Rivularia sp. PCC 7116 TaxID=373994 RepID=UPI00029F4DEC|nr:sulfurtransferase [Rivularia sp. PCC 7116]AFY53127.1 rhodanese-related sulfurtransferase [Rivularia sp. PCC 7116]
MKHTSSIVSNQWLFENLNHPDIAIFDCRFSLANPQEGKQQYETSHIPGAYYLDLNQDLSSKVQQHGGRHPLPDIEEFSDKLSAMGVNYEETFVIAYDDSRFAFASRLWWLLRYLGHKQVAVLDGGFNGWLASEFPVTDILPTSCKGAFIPQPQTQMIVDRETVKNSKDSSHTALIDSRDNERYQGLREPIDKIAGHIPGAMNYPWKEVTDSNGYLLPREQQSQRWEKLENDREIIVYCGSGVTACVNLLSLDLAGINTGKLYPGSWSDWISYYE